MSSAEEDPETVGMENGGKGLMTNSKGKIKRVRQRVDAGEPRNSYASIPNFSSRPPTQSALSPLSSAYHSNGYACKMLQSMYDEKMHPLMMLDGMDRSGSSGLNGSSSVSLANTNPARLYLNGGSGTACDLSTLYGGVPRSSMVGMSPIAPMSPDSSPTAERSSSNGSGTSTNSHLLRDILQQGRKFSSGAGDSPPAHVPPPIAASKGGTTSVGHGPSETQGGAEEEAVQETSDQSAAGSRSERPDSIREGSPVDSRASCNMMRMMSAEPTTLSSPPAATAAAAASPAGVTTTVEPAASPASSPGRSCCSPRSAAATPNWQTSSASGNNNNGSTNDLEVKRARVETIVSNMLQGPARSQGSCPGLLGEQHNPVNGCKKRKLYQPQQHETSSRSTTLNGDVDTFDDDDDDDLAEPLAKRRNSDMLMFQRRLRQMQEQLVAMQQHYIQMMDADSAEEEDNRSPRAVSHMNNSGQRSPDISDYEDKPCLSEINKEDRGLDNNQQPDYDNASMYDDHRRLVIDQDKLSGSSRHEQSASNDGGLKETRKSCIVQPSNYGGSNLDYEWLAESLKAELSTSLSQIVDAVMSRCVSQRKVASSSKIEADPEPPPKDPTLLSQMLDRKSPRTTKVIDRGARVNGIGTGLRASPYPQDIPTTAPKPFFFPFKPPTSIAAATAAFLYGSPPQMPPLSLSQPFSSSPVHSTSTPQSISLDMPEQTEPVSLVVAPKKKRHKVTDTRLNPRGPLQLTPLRGNGMSQDSQDISPKYSSMLGSLASSEGLPPQQHLYSHHPPPPPLVPVSLPTTVAIPNPSLNQSDLFHGFAYDPHRMSQYSTVDPEEDSSTPSSIHHPLLPSHGHMHQRGSPDSLHYSHMKQEGGGGGGGDISDTGDSPAAYDSGMSMISFLPMHTSTLTPMHLRKAKLMFFYARYPSSAVLKMYFPDIKFNKNNTAQLVKWFSNFREFYYIQMEKYARQAMSEGVKVSEDLKVTPDSELLRVLNLHYNRNNHIEAPENFRYVVEQTLREFFKALVAGKDSEQSWKKSIYKIIARLDDNVPEYFKSPNFLETLE